MTGLRKATQSEIRTRLRYDHEQPTRARKAIQRSNPYVGLMRWKILDDLTTAEMQVAADIIVNTCKTS